MDGAARFLFERPRAPHAAPDRPATLRCAPAPVASALYFFALRIQPGARAAFQAAPHQAPQAHPIHVEGTCSARPTVAAVVRHSAPALPAAPLCSALAPASALFAHPQAQCAPFQTVSAIGRIARSAYRSAPARGDAIQS